MDRMKPARCLKIIRRALGLTQEEFAVRYRIPLGILRDWEQGAKKPDQAARAYLRGDRRPSGRRAAYSACTGLAAGVR